ncbi:MAG TPA: adenylyl-sulfate kinase [Polyangiaceae bacterium]|jgi:adenylylsulfate kinase
MHFEARTRSIAKAISYRVAATVGTAIFVYALTGNLRIALFAGGLDVVVKIAIYYANERVWDRIRLGKRVLRPSVVWFTGLPASGKSTIAHEVAEGLAVRGMQVEELDGESVRHLFPETGFSRADRDQHVKRVGHLASRLESHGVVVVASFVSPYAEARRFVRGLCRSFIEVHVATPLEECEKRDPKGLYRKARAGELPGFTGIDAPYEVPEKPELRIDTTQMSAGDAAEKVIALVMKEAGRG